MCTKLDHLLFPTALLFHVGFRPVLLGDFAMVQRPKHLVSNALER